MKPTEWLLVLIIAAIGWQAARAWQLLVTWWKESHQPKPKPVIPDDLIECVGGSRDGDQHRVSPGVNRLCFPVLRPLAITWYDVAGDEWKHANTPKFDRIYYVRGKRRPDGVVEFTEEGRHE